MRITPSQSAQRSLTKQYWKQCREILYKTTLPVLQAAETTAPQELKNRVSSLLKPEPMEKYLNDLWSKVGGKYASDTARMIRNKKSLEDPELEMWEQGFRAYMADRSKKIAKQILTTQEATINSVIDKIVAAAFDEGDSISVIAGALRDKMEAELVSIQRYEAERIARTEVIGASNKGSFDGAKSTGLEMQKSWMTSGLVGVRETHQNNEMRGWVNMDAEFTGGIQYPGDASGPPEEIINCRCTIIYNADI